MQGVVAARLTRPVEVVGAGAHADLGGDEDAVHPVLGAGAVHCECGGDPVDELGPEAEAA